MDSMHPEQMLLILRGSRDLINIYAKAHLRGDGGEWIKRITDNLLHDIELAINDLSHKSPAPDKDLPIE